MPLTATDAPPAPHEDRNAIGVWMRNGGESGPLVRVFVSYEALWQSEPSKAPDAISARDIFIAGRERFEKLASDRYDESGPDDGEHSGHPIIIIDIL